MRKQKGMSILVQWESQIFNLQRLTLVVVMFWFPRGILLHCCCFLINLGLWKLCLDHRSIMCMCWVLCEKLSDRWHYISVVGMSPLSLWGRGEDFNLHHDMKQAKHFIFISITKKPISIANLSPFGAALLSSSNANKSLCTWLFQCTEESLGFQAKTSLSMTPRLSRIPGGTRLMSSLLTFSLPGNICCFQCFVRLLPHLQKAGMFRWQAGGLAPTQRGLVSLLKALMLYFNADTGSPPPTARQGSTRISGLSIPGRGLQGPHSAAWSCFRLFRIVFSCNILPRAAAAAGACQSSQTVSASLLAGLSYIPSVLPHGRHSKRVLQGPGSWSSGILRNSLVQGNGCKPGIWLSTLLLLDKDPPPAHTALVKGKLPCVR